MKYQKNNRIKELANKRIKEFINKRIKYEDKGPVIQGGVQNYLGKQPQVMAPRKWKSAPDKPATELAYITEAEKKLIMKADIHGGLER